ncbi:hypothetical protein OA93_22770 [Flavobacterium sp. KMS]|uniref:hypothetical protein n=1 Tax=Flavobacterium sp. KMS TaxID=1566023 RepID=UPI00057CDC94|nr:hypothetical protein [Flavobacterium sp. KMS]KIA92901.1 hypothetical protein OA93_22770 [Flavobacterium sp. KMS]
MKISTLLLSLFFVIQLTFAQSTLIQDPPKKTWKILVKNNKTAEENFKMIGQTLIENNYSIEKKDKEFLFIQTSPKNLQKLNASYFLNFTFKDNLIILSGMSKMNISINFGSITTESNYEKIINKGMRGSIMKESFNEMLQFATLLPKSEYDFITD